MVKERIEQIISGKIDPFLFVIGENKEDSNLNFFQENKEEIKEYIHSKILSEEMTLYQLYSLIVVLFETNTFSTDVEEYLNANIKGSKNADNMKLLKSLIGISDNKNGFEEYVKEISLAFEQK